MQEHNSWGKMFGGQKLKEGDTRSRKLLAVEGKDNVYFRKVPLWRTHVDTFFPDTTLEQQKEIIMGLFKELEEYGVRTSIIDFDIGNSQEGGIMGIMNYKIDGLKLDDLGVFKDNKEQAIEESTHTFIGLIKYLVDKYKSGGVFIGEMGRDPEQYRFGKNKEKGESESHLVLVDTDPFIFSADRNHTYGNPRQPILEITGIVTEIVRRCEKELGVVLVDFRKEAQELLSQLEVSEGDESALLNAALFDNEHYLRQAA